MLQHLQCLRNEFPDEFTRLPRTTEGLNQLGIQEYEREAFLLWMLFVCYCTKKGMGLDNQNLTLICIYLISQVFPKKGL